jgi:predicted MFS family arabinose efflux permease
MKTRTSTRTRRSLVDSSALKDVPYILFNCGLLFGFMGIYVIFYYIELYALLESNVAPTLANFILVIVNASSILGRLIPPFYADKMGSINVQTAVALICALLTFCLIAIANLPGLIVFSLLYGFFAGTFMGLPAAGVARLSGDHSTIGTRLGMTLTFVGLGVLVSNPIAGAILGEERNWIGLICWCGTLLAVSGASMWASRVAKVGFALVTVI